jgi:hypothetical protein
VTTVSILKEIAEFGLKTENVRGMKICCMSESKECFIERRNKNYENMGSY